MIMFASYNKYNNNILHDTIAVSFVNAITSLLVGIFAFATIGNIAHEQNSSVEDVITDGPGLIFVVYPQALAKMPYSQMWAVLFFFMLLCLGLNSQVCNLVLVCFFLGSLVGRKRVCNSNNSTVCFHSFCSSPMLFEMCTNATPHAFPAKLHYDIVINAMLIIIKNHLLC